MKVVLCLLPGIIVGGFLFGNGGVFHSNTEQAQQCIARYY